MKEQWNQLKETIVELRDNGGTGNQQDVCKFLANLMENLEKEFTEKFVKDLTINDGEGFGNARAEGIVLSWSANIGFGELTIYRDKEGGDGKWHADTECLGEDFVRMVLNKWVDDMEIR